MLALAFCLLSQTDASSPELSNFHQVNAGLYRGAQPRAGGLRRLKSLGVRTILNLRGGDAETRAEGDEARQLGLRYYNVALPDLSAPSDKNVEQALAIINQAENQPVFVHCHHGEDRTGTIIACYRISHDGWTATDARKEAETFGMSSLQRGMKRYIDKFYQEWQKRGKPDSQLPSN